jgi:hypothetical protein
LKKVNLADFSKELGDFAERSLKAKRKAVLAGIARSIPDLVAASPVDTGLYAASWGFTADEHSAFVGNYAPYAGVIEYGARPHWVPIEPLLAWAKRVLNHGGSATSHSQPETNFSPEVWALAKAVQAKIAAKGQQPRHVMENMIPTIIDNIRKELRESLR